MNTHQVAVAAGEGLRTDLWNCTGEAAEGQGGQKVGKPV